MWNAWNVSLFKVPAEAALDNTVREVMTADLAAEVEALDEQMLTAPGVQRRVHPRMVPGRGRRWIESTRAPILGDAGQVLHIVSTQLDVTDERAHMDELHLASKVFETTVDGIMVTDQDDRVIMVNAAFTAMTGHSGADVVGRLEVELALRPMDMVDSPARRELLQRDGRAAGEVQHVRKDGAVLSLWITATCVRDVDGVATNYVRVFTDISLLKETQRQLEQMASFDGLTGLPNRRLLHYRLAQTLPAAHRNNNVVAALFIDLDGFKEVNDQLGHAVGDLLLRDVAVRLEQCIRASDTAARWGGDEFAVIMEGGDRNARVVGERIVAAMATPFSIEGQQIRISASVGIALSAPGDGGDESILENADAAMFHAKRDGGGRVRFHADAPAMTT